MGMQFPCFSYAILASKNRSKGDSKSVNRLDTFAIFDGAANLALEMQKTSVIISSTQCKGVVAEKRGQSLRFLNPVQSSGQDCLSKSGATGLVLGSVIRTPGRKCAFQIPRGVTRLLSGLSLPRSAWERDEGPNA